MPNTSNSFKTGEKVIIDGEYECVHCQQIGKRTARSLSVGDLFPHCDECGTKDSTFRLKPA
jgi:NAD-dependent SIR2 family protein deacetylase